MANKPRFFIVGPTEIGKSVGDTLHQLCSTQSRGTIDDVYMNDEFEEVYRGSEKEVRSFAKQMGLKRVQLV
jgi:hypothetical protein